MKIYDKASWHIDANVGKETVNEYFKTVFNWLDENGFLNDEGKEIHDLGTFTDVSLHEGLLTVAGQMFLEMNYDEILAKIPHGDARIVDALNGKL